MFRSLLVVFVAFFPMIQVKVRYWQRFWLKTRKIKQSKPKKRFQKAET